MKRTGNLYILIVTLLPASARYSVLPHVQALAKCIWTCSQATPQNSQRRNMEQQASAQGTRASHPQHRVGRGQPRAGVLRRRSSRLRTKLLLPKELVLPAEQSQSQMMTMMTLHSLQPM